MTTPSEHAASGVIRSRQNPKVKAARALLRPQGRKKQRRFLVEGLAHVGEALEAGWPLAEVFWSPDRLRSDFGRRLVAQAREWGVPVWAVTPEVLDSLSPREHSQGLVAVAEVRWTSLDALTPRAHPWAVAVTAPQDPGNIGALLRTMDAVGAGPLLLLEGGADPFQPKAVRASMGALFRHPVVRAGFPAFVAWARKQRYRVYGTSAHGRVDYRQVAYRRPMVLLLGNERHGLTADQRAACDVLVRLPMRGRVSSLNLAVAAGVMLYAMLGEDTGETP